MGRTTVPGTQIRNAVDGVGINTEDIEDSAIVNEKIASGTIDLTTKATYVPLNKAGDTLNGNLNLNSHDVTNGNSITATTVIVDTLNHIVSEYGIRIGNAYFIGRTFSVDPNTVTWGVAQKGFKWFNATDNQEKMWNGTKIVLLG